MWKHFFALISAVLLRVLDCECKEGACLAQATGEYPKGGWGLQNREGWRVELGHRSQPRSRGRLDHGDPALCEDGLSAAAKEAMSRGHACHSG